MFNSPILDLIILLTFTYFMGSLLLSTINESITQGLFNLRQTSLKDALEGLFLDANWKAYVRETLIKSPHLQSLMKEEKKYPAYIPSNNFVLAIIQAIGSQNYLQGKLQTAIGTSNLPQSFKQVLEDIAAQGDNKLEDFEKGLTQFYNDAMDRAGGWYKRKVRMILLALGFLTAALLNIDTIKISKDALSNKKQLNETVDKIVEQLPKIQIDKSGVNSTVTIKGPDGKIMITQKATLDALTDTTDKAKSLKSSIETFHTIEVFYENTSLVGLGYKDAEDAKTQWLYGETNGKRDSSFNISVLLIKLLGLLITAFALQLGSSYWFDLLNKVVNIRGVGKKPNEEKTA